MGLSFGTQRPLVEQDVLTFALTVSATTPTQISSTLNKNRLINSFLISNPVAGSSVYLGTSNVTLPAGANPGVEIQAGQAIPFRISQEDRQLYELQTLLVAIAEQLKCQNVEKQKIPFIVWDLTQLYLISAAVVSSTVTIAAFPQMYL